MNVRETGERFLRFLLTGGVAAIVDVCVFTGLFELGVSALLAATGSFLIAATVSYVLASLFIYQRTPELRMLVKFLCAYLIGLGVNVTVTLMGMEWLGFGPALAKIGGIGVACIFNFAVMNFILFANRAASDKIT